MKKALAGPTFQPPRGLSPDQTLDLLNEVARFTAEVVAAERERCARLADDMDYSPDGAIAAAIRKGS